MKNWPSQLFSFKCVLSFVILTMTYFVFVRFRYRALIFSRKSYFSSYTNRQISLMPESRAPNVYLVLDGCFVFFVFIAFLSLISVWVFVLFRLYGYLNCFFFCYGFSMTVFLISPSFAVISPIGENEFSNSCRKLQMHENSLPWDEWVQFFECWTIFSVKHQIPNDFCNTSFLSQRYTIDNNFWFTLMEFFLSISQFNFFSFVVVVFMYRKRGAA